MLALAAGGMTLWGWAAPDEVTGLLRFLLVSGAAIVVVSGAGLLWRRRHGGSGKWIRVATTSATAGTLVGCFASRVAADSTMTAAYVTTVVTTVAMAVAWVALIRPLTLGESHVRNR